MERSHYEPSQVHIKPDQRDFKAYLEDIVESIEKILRYINAVRDIDEFLRNEMVMDAVTRNYEIIGEAANKIPQVVKEKYPEVPWRQMYGLRSFAMHEYHTIDPIILWEIDHDHLPENKIQLKNILEEERKSVN